mmetsp:Transcript_55732/g.169592  ORF Transcript_55732/g.169592 Transcript_55732/m.169592 type:complete len:200 (-) Transcript_55732:542-1141(-)
MVRSQRFSRWSPEHEAKRPSRKGAHLTATTSLSWPFNLCNGSFKVLASHTQTSLSFPATARRWPWWWFQATARTSSALTLACRVAAVFARRSHNRKKPSSPTVAKDSASGEDTARAHAKLQSAPTCAEATSMKGAVGVPPPDARSASQRHSRPSLPPDASTRPLPGVTPQSRAKPSTALPSRGSSVASGLMVPAGRSAR